MDRVNPIKIFKNHADIQATPVVTLDIPTFETTSVQYVGYTKHLDKLNLQFSNRKY